MKVICGIIWTYILASPVAGFNLSSIPGAPFAGQPLASCFTVRICSTLRVGHSNWSLCCWINNEAGLLRLESRPHDAKQPMGSMGSMGHLRHQHLLTVDLHWHHAKTRHIHIFHTSHTSAHVRMIADINWDS